MSTGEACESSTSRERSARIALLMSSAERFGPGALMRVAVSGFFIVAVALIAAVAGDAVVEGLSNANLFWHGEYTDRSSLDLLPVSLVAVVIAIATLGLILLSAARCTGLSPRRLMVAAAQLVPRDIVRLAPVIFGTQLAALFAMETTEQIAAFGHAMGGTVWLGGPVAISLLIHAVFAFVCASSLAQALHQVANRVIRAMSGIIARYLRFRRAIPTRRAPFERTLRTASLVVITSSRKRGPPAAAWR